MCIKKVIKKETIKYIFLKKKKIDIIFFFFILFYDKFVVIYTYNSIKKNTLIM
jgi:hypothetical protein